MCDGLNGQGCMFSSRFNEGGDHGTLRTVAATLKKSYLESLQELTVRALYDPLQYGAFVLAAVDQLREEHFRNSPNEVRICMNILKGLPTGGSTATPYEVDAARSLSIEDRICQVVQVMDQAFGVDNYYIYPQSIENEVARNLRGSSLERSLLLMALVRTCIPSSAVDVRIVMSPVVSASPNIVGALKVEWILHYLQFRLAQDRRLPPQEAWRWASALHPGGSKPSTKPPTSNDKKRPFLAIRSSGVFEDATMDQEADGVLYCASTFRSKILERNISYAQTASFVDEKRRKVREELKNLLVEQREDAGTKIRNSHRQLILFERGNHSQVADVVNDYNTALELSCVNNSSLVPLRSYPGETKIVHKFLQDLEQASSTSDIARLQAKNPNQLRDPCHLVRRCLVHWPVAGKQTMLLAIAELVAGQRDFLLGPSEMAFLLGSENVYVLDALQNVNTDKSVIIALLRLLENLFTYTNDHLAAVEQLGHLAVRILEAATDDGMAFQQGLSGGGAHTPYAPPSIHAPSKVTLYEGELEYQLSITIQVVAQSVTIATLSSEEDDESSEQTQSLIKKLSHTLMTTLVKSIRNATQSYRESIFTLIEAADVVISPPLVAMVNQEGMSMLVNALQLAYSTCPLQELVKLVEVVTSLNTSVTRRR